MDNLFCIDINASGRFIQDQDVNICRQPFCHQDFLLVTAGEAVYLSVSVCRINAHLVNLFVYKAVLFLAVIDNAGAASVNNT